MSTPLRLLAVAALAFGLAGCERLPLPALSGGPPTGSLAVINLDAVAKALGREASIKKQLEDAEGQLNAQLTEFGQKLQEELQEEREKIASGAEGEAPAKLQQLAIEVQRKAQQARQEALRQGTQYRQRLMVEFRDEVRPIAASVARARGAQVVVGSNTVLWNEAAVDITAEVIDRMKATGS